MLREEILRDKTLWTQLTMAVTAQEKDLWMKVFMFVDIIAGGGGRGKELFQRIILDEWKFNIFFGKKTAFIKYYDTPLIDSLLLILKLIFSSNSSSSISIF